MPDETPPETPSFVTKEELASTADGLISRIQEIVQGVAAAARVGTPPAATPPPQPTFDLNALDQAIKDGASGSAEQIDALVRSRVKAQLDAFNATEVSPLRTTGLSNLEAIAKKTTLKDLEHSKKYEKEIDQFMAGVPDAVRANPEGWQFAYDTIIGRHHEDLKREAVEAAIRIETSKAPAPAPSSSTAFMDEEGKVPVPSPEELLGPEAKELMAIKGVGTPDELVKTMGYASWKDYVRMAREYDTDAQYNKDNPHNLYPKSPKGVKLHARA